MLITKFNRMIRSRVLWAAFALLVSIAFVGVFSRSGGCTENERASGVVGRLYGKNISANAFLMARLFAMGMRDSGSLSPEANLIIHRNTWKRLAALKTAEELGISTSDEEVSEAIQRDPTFAVNGFFNKEKYEAVVRSRMRVGIEIFEEFLRQEITIRKLVNMLESAVWTSPFELDQKLKSLTDSFTVQCAILDAKDQADDVHITTEDARKFFNENSELFTVPEKVNVRYVAFPISNYTSGITIEDESIFEYYTNHLEEYSTTNTNNEMSAFPIEEVHDDILRGLRREAAISDAKDEVTRFVVALTPDRYGNALSMDKIVAEYGLTICTSGFFSATGNVPNLSVDLAFNRAAFDLQPDDPERYFSDAIVGQDAVYVIAANDKLEAHVPDFSEVVDLAISQARRDAEHEAFVEKSRQIRTSVENALQSGKTFEQAVHKFDINVSTTATFTAYSALSEEFEYFDTLFPNIIWLKKGELADLLEFKGDTLLAYVMDRQPGDPASMDFIKAQLLSTVDSYRADILFDEWQENMLTKAGFEDFAPPITTSDKDND